MDRRQRTADRRPRPARLTRDSMVSAAHYLAKRDRHLATVLERHGPPPLWARPASYSTLVLIILEQQVSLASARSAFTRLAAHAGEVTPKRMLELGPTQLRTCGLTRQKARYVVALADALEGEDLRLNEVGRMSDEDARAALTTVPGIGQWTANIYLLMALRRPDVWPVHDLALRQSFRHLRGLREAPTDDRLARWATRWSPYRSVAARLLWHHYLKRSR